MFQICQKLRRGLFIGGRSYPQIDTDLEAKARAECGGFDYGLRQAQRRNSLAHGTHELNEMRTEMGLGEGSF